MPAIFSAHRKSAGLHIATALFVFYFIFPSNLDAFVKSNADGARRKCPSGAK